MPPLSQPRPGPSVDPAGATGSPPDSFSDLVDLDAEIGVLAHDLGRGTDEVRPLTSFVASEATWSPFRIGRYTALRRIGSGGMGVVYAAYDDELDRRVAIKIVRRVEADDAPEATATVRREAQALARLSHPNVLAVHEVGLHDESSAGHRGNDPVAAGKFVFIVMEFVVGKTLRDWWSDGPRPWRELLDAVVQAGRGLAAVHRAGMVHRDVKPENVMIGDDGRVRLMDFGLARAGSDEHLQTLGGGSGDRLAMPTLSRSGALVGTPAYMAPEQFDRPDVGPAADQFALGVMAWEGFFGERPFPGDTLEKLRGNVVGGNRREPARPRVIPAYLRRALERAVATLPEDRWPDVDALLRAISRGSQRRWWALTLPLAAVATIAVAVPRAVVECDDRDAQLGGIWDDASRDRVRTGLLATRVAYADETWTRVEQGLDAHAQAWMTAYTSACERREVNLSDALRTAQAVCLAENKRALGATIEILAHADDTVIERAVQVVSGLAAVEQCEDVERLAAKVAPPEDAEVAAQVDALRERLVDLGVMLGAGAYRTALPLAHAIVVEARDLDYPPVLAQGLLREAWAQEALADYAPAEANLRESYAVAISAGDDATAADAAVDLVRLVGHGLARPEDGLEWGFHAKGVVQRVGHGGPEAERLENLGAVQVDKGDAAAALAEYQEALAVHRRNGDGDSVRVATTLDGLGRAYRMLADYPAAMENLSRALEIRETQLSPRHPAVGSTHLAIASVCVMKDDLGCAQDHYSRALEVYEDALGPDHPNVATALDGLGSVHRYREHPALAVPLHERALAIRERTLVADHPELSTSLSYLGHAEVALGNPAAARAYFERGLAMDERRTTGDHPQLAGFLSSIADTYALDGDFERAREFYRRCLDVKERTIGTQHPSFAVTVMEIGGTYLEQGRYAEAMEETLRGAAILENALGSEHPDIGNAVRVVGVLHDKLGHPELALVAYERALTLLEPSDPPPTALAELRFELAQALWTVGKDRPRAITQAQKAAEFYAVSVPGTDAALEVERWLARARADQLAGR